MGSGRVSLITCDPFSAKSRGRGVKLEYHVKIVRACDGRRLQEDFDIWMPLRYLDVRNNSLVF
jgi:hypothetical protein